MHVAIGIAEFLEEAIHEDRNVALALAQRRQLDLHHIEAKKQVLAELALAHGHVEIPVGGGDNASGDGNAIVRSHWLHFPFLQGAQELGLQVHRQIADFVEEERAIAG